MKKLIAILVALLTGSVGVAVASASHVAEATLIN
jgi:hypothetical protein